MALNIQGAINSAVKNTPVRQSTLPQTQSMPGAPAPKPSPYALNIPNTVPSTALSANLTPADVMRKRNTNASQLDTIKQKALGIQDLLTRASAPIDKPGALSNPDEFLTQTFRNEGRMPTQAETSRDSLLNRATETTKKFFAGRDKAMESAQTQYGVADKADQLAQTRESIAKRRVKLREDLRAFETSSELRGVARGFAQDNRQQMTADATAELADLAIIESAQLGNLEEARSLSTDLIDKQYEAYTGEIQQMQAELDALAPTLSEEEKNRAMQIQVALDERVRIIEDRKTVEKDKRSIMIEAASNGADQGTLAAIRNASSAEEAVIAAGSYMRTPMGGGGGLTTSQMLSQVNGLRDDVRNDPDVKDFISIRDGYERVAEGADQNNAQGDLALLFGYMKMLDPTSVVRETEFDNAEAAMGHAQRVLNIPDKYINGSRLTPEARQQFKQSANGLYRAKEVNYNRAIDFYKNSAQTYGIDTNLVVRDFGTSRTVDSQNYDQETAGMSFGAPSNDGTTSGGGPISSVLKWFTGFKGF